MKADSSVSCVKNDCILQKVLCYTNPATEVQQGCPYDFTGDKIHCKRLTLSTVQPKHWKIQGLYKQYLDWTCDGNLKRLRTGRWCSVGGGGSWEGQLAQVSWLQTLGGLASCESASVFSVLVGVEMERTIEQRVKIKVWVKLKKTPTAWSMRFTVSIIQNSSLSVAQKFPGEPRCRLTRTACRTSINQSLGPTWAKSAWSVEHWPSSERAGNRRGRRDW